MRCSSLHKNQMEKEEHQLKGLCSPLANTASYAGIDACGDGRAGLRESGSETSIGEAGTGHCCVACPRLGKLRITEMPAVSSIHIRSRERSAAAQLILSHSSS